MVCIVVDYFRASVSFPLNMCVYHGNKGKGVGGVVLGLTLVLVWAVWARIRLKVRSRVRVL